MLFWSFVFDSPTDDAIPNRPITSWRRRMDVDVTSRRRNEVETASLRRIDVRSESLRRHVPAW